MCPVVHSIVELLAFDSGTVGCYLVQLFTLFTLKRINAALNANAAAFISFQGLKKPYNPILGETFRCCWLHPQTNSCTFYIAEQVRPVFELEAINMCRTAKTLCASQSKLFEMLKPNFSSFALSLSLSLSSALMLCYSFSQVSHHPPISAFHVCNRKDGFSISGSILAKSKFYGKLHSSCQGQHTLYTTHKFILLFKGS